MRARAGDGSWAQAGKMLDHLEQKSRASVILTRGDSVLVHYFKPVNRSNRRIRGSVGCGVADKLVMRPKIPLPIMTVDLQKRLTGWKVSLINRNFGGVMIMNKSSSLQRVSGSIFALALALFAAQSAFASPTTEITRAVNVAGGADLKHAAPSIFMQGFNAVIIKVKQAKTPLYVSAAVKMR